MSIERLENEIRKLRPHEREELFRRLGILKGKEEKRRGGPDDPLAKLIGIVEISSDSSKRYKEDLYGGRTPL
ncbi:MAG TPA: hypothetical protein GXX19_03025 [Syntrophomonadaceae bacterium]|nr:hypothetical protein [Syntrophomonadaceae bacterium]